MAHLVKRESFIKMCYGLKSKDLTVYIKRGKVLATDDGLFDIEDHVNKIFLENRKVNSEKKGVVAAVEPVTKSSKQVDVLQVKEPTGKKEGEQLEIEVRDMAYDQLIKEKEITTILKGREEIEIKRIQKEKLMGIVVPTEIVKGVFARQMKSVTTAYHQSAQIIATGIVYELGGSREHQAKIRKLLVEKINKAIEESYELGVKEIDALVDEYTEVRSKGERKT